jgi:hypothetical protein
MSAISTTMKIIFFIGLVLIMISLVKVYNECPAQNTVYRYIPRSYLVDQEIDPVPLNDLFYGMFNDPSPWSFPISNELRRIQLGRPIVDTYLNPI